MIYRKSLRVTGGAQFNFDKLMIEKKREQNRHYSKTEILMIPSRKILDQETLEQTVNLSRLATALDLKIVSPHTICLVRRKIRKSQTSKNSFELTCRKQLVNIFCASILSRLLNNFIWFSLTKYRNTVPNFIMKIDTNSIRVDFINMR